MAGGDGGERWLPKPGGGKPPAQQRAGYEWPEKTDWDEPSAPTESSWHSGGNPPPPLSPSPPSFTSSTSCSTKDPSVNSVVNSVGGSYLKS